MLFLQKYVTSSVTLLLAAGFLMACSQHMAHVEQHGSQFYGWEEQKSALLSDEPPSSMTVQRGDSVYKVAQRYGVEVKDIIALNHLSAPYWLAAGQRLVLPHYRKHQVKARETLSAIARQHRVPLNALVAKNNLRHPFVIEVGQVLKVPLMRVPPKREVNMAELDQSTHTSAPSTPIKRQSSIKTVKIVSSPPSFVPEPTFRPSTKAPPYKKRVVQVKKQEEYIPLFSKLGMSSSSFIWPVQGRVLSRYGPKKGGERNDGINIMTKQNAPVHAAAEGIVVYSGSALRGYGNLLIIKHPSNWLTAYAHQSKLLVQKGMRVKQGQVIGYVGNTGNVNKPQLHFGIRNHKQKAVNPEKYLPPVRRRSS